MQPPPAAGLVAAEPGLADQRHAAVRLGQPDRHGRRAERGEGLTQQGAGDRAARGRGFRGGPGQADLVRARLRRLARRFLAGDLGSQFRRAHTGVAGQAGQLALGLGGRAAELLHQHAPGQVHDRAGGGPGAQVVQLLPLPGHQRVQPRHLGPARFRHGHQHSRPRPSPRARSQGRTCSCQVLFSAITRRDRIDSRGLTAWHARVERAVHGRVLPMTTIHQRAVQPADGGPLMGEIASVFNGMNDQLALFTSEVTRVAREVGTEGRLGGQAEVPGLAGTWKDLTDSVNSMAGNLTGQVRDVARVATAVAKGDLSQQISVDVKGEMLELKDTLNTMVDELSAFADEVTRVAREVGTEGRLGGQARVPGVGGTWRDLTDSVNSMAGNLTGQVRNIAQVTTAVAKGDLSQKITVDARGEILELKNTVNTMVDELSAFADEVTRVARE